MKKQLLFLLTAILSVNCYSQISFDKGYFIDNNDQKTECLIKNMDWKNNPTGFEYALSENTKEYNADIKSVKEFGIYNYSKYIRSDVNIDRSSSNLNDLSAVRNPIFKEEKLFLKVLIEGQSNLYQYEDGNLVRFFYKKDNTNIIEQLVFKNYQSSGDIIGENNLFKQQLFNDLKCQRIKANDIKKINYKKSDLVNLFIKYNQCNNYEIVNFEEKQIKDLFNLTPRLGLNNSSLSIQNTISSSRNADFGNKLGLRLGIEAEIILPFNKNKWAIIVEPTYQYFKSETSTFNINVDYTSIELPIGIRHYFFINNNSKLFINGSFILDITSNSTISYDNGAELEITKSSNLGFGIGYKQNDKYSLELRYHTSREILNGYQSYYSEYKKLSIILGYSLF